jgi:hypothetical protein
MPGTPEYHSMRRVHGRNAGYTSRGTRSIWAVVATVVFFACFVAGLVGILVVAFNVFGAQ